MTPRASTVSWSAARARRDAVRDVCLRALGELAADRFGAALALAERALGLVQDLDVRWGVDEQAVDQVLLVACMLGQASSSSADVSRIKIIYGRAVRLRASALLGQSCAIVREGDRVTHLSGVGVTQTVGS